MTRDSDRSGEASETRSGSTVGESAGRKASPESGSMNPTAGKPMPSEAAGLVERIEAAEGPTRYLDRMIRAALTATEEPANRPTNAPAYTASIDAAMTLVPEGWHWNVDAWPEEAGATMHPVGKEYLWRLTKAATPALALCAAALKARAHPQPETDT